MRAFAVLVLCSTLAGCADPLGEDVNRILRLTVPPDATATSLIGTGEPSAWVWTWQVTAPGWSWKRYAEWLQRQLRPEFSATPGERELRFGKTLSGDAYSLVVRPRTTQRHASLC